KAKAFARTTYSILHPKGPAASRLAPADSRSLLPAGGLRNSGKMTLSDSRCAETSCTMRPRTVNLRPERGGNSWQGAWARASESRDWYAVSDPPMSDERRQFEALMRQVQDGSEEAARELCTSYFDHIIKCVRRRLRPALRPRFDSVDFVQKVWKSVFEERHRLC